MMASVVVSGFPMWEPLHGVVFSLTLRLRHPDVSEQLIPKDVQRFIAEHIRSVVVLEALLLIYAQPGRGWSARELGTELRVDPDWTQRELAELARRGVIRREESGSSGRSGSGGGGGAGGGGSGGEDPRYTYVPGGPEDPTLAALTEAYQERRVSVISLIFAKPPDAIQNFADAFNLRKDRHGR
jgi:hypothetical protein